MSELMVLDLFEGGKEGIYKRMRNVIKDGLENKIEEITAFFKPKVVNKTQVVNAIADKLGLESKILFSILNGTSNGEVNYKLFEQLEFSIGVSIQNVLGKPVGLSNPEVSKQWLEEQKERPIVGAAFLNGSLSQDSKEGYEDVNLKLYVFLRAIKELS